MPEINAWRTTRGAPDTTCWGASGARYHPTAPIAVAGVGLAGRRYSSDGLVLLRAPPGSVYHLQRG